jgi:CheY-like chemotaxis protein
MRKATYFEQISVEDVQLMLARQSSDRPTLNDQGYRAMPERRFEPKDATTTAPSAVERARILVVDPDEDTRSMYREWFQTSGCDVVEATDGRDALTKALVRRPALVITEIRLPFIDGHALCEILRVDYLTRGVPILVVTSDARAPELARVRTSGATAVLVKPVTPDQMLAETQRLLIDGAAVSDRVSATPYASKLSQPHWPARRLSKSFARVSTLRPPLEPPAARCPLCDRLLTYKHSHLGGVSERHREQWDWYECPASCGTFEYRHRTRHLRHVVEAANRQ